MQIAEETLEQMIHMQKDMMQITDGWKISDIVSVVKTGPKRDLGN